MRKRVAMLGLVLLLAPQVARADYLDVITLRLGDCSLEKYMEIVEDFRAVIKQQNYPYSVEIAVPLMNDQLDVVYWIGRAPNFQSFGEGFSRWEREILKRGTPEAKVNDKFQECGENVSRTGHLTQ